jgi:hypothetical protein
MAAVQLAIPVPERKAAHCFLATDFFFHNCYSRIFADVSNCPSCPEIRNRNDPRVCPLTTSR